MALRTRTRFVRPAPRTSLWIGAGLGNTTLVGSSKQLIGSLNAAALLLRPFTVVRTRLDVRFESDQAAASEKPTGALGFIVLNDNATAIGPTAVGGPVTEPNADWFAYQGLLTHFQFLSSVGFQGDASAFFVVNSKAMRKVGPDQDIAIVTELRSASGAVIAMEGRMLVKLH